MQQRLAARQPEAVHARADDSENSFGVFERRRGGHQVIAPRTEILAVGAVEIALHGHVIHSQPRREPEIAALQPEQVLQICEHGVDYKDMGRWMGLQFG